MENNKRRAAKLFSDRIFLVTENRLRHTSTPLECVRRRCRRHRRTLSPVSPRARCSVVGAHSFNERTARPPITHPTPPR